MKNLTDNKEYTVFAGASKQLSFSQCAEQTADYICIHTTVENNSNQEISLKEVELFSGSNVSSSYSLTFLECCAMLGAEGIYSADAERESYGLMGYTVPDGSKALLFGMSDFSEYFYRFVSVPTANGQHSLRIAVDFQGRYLKAHERVKIADLYILQGQSLSALLTCYARKVAENMHVQPKHSLDNFGWCSWYYYYGTESSQNLYADLAEYKQSEIGDKLDFFLIDDGWNERENRVCVWGDWTPGVKYPNGMKDAADKIHAMGLQAGLWLAPFSVDRNSSLFREHPDWLAATEEEIHDTGKLKFGLDLTNPNVLEFERETFTRVFDEWGFDFVKVDFMQHGAGSGPRYNRYCSGAKAYRQGMEVIRACAKDKMILNCGSPLLQTIGFCDMCRIGADVGGRWYFALNPKKWPDGNCSIKPCTRYVVSRVWMNGIFWKNDPDCIVLRDRCNGIEDGFFSEKTFAQEFHLSSSPKDFGLRDNEADLWLKLVVFTGGVRYISERWSELPRERRELLKKWMNVRFGRCSMVDVYSNRDVFILKAEGEEKYVGIFNISENDLQVNVPLARLGVKDVCAEAQVYSDGEVLKFPMIRAHSAEIYKFG